MNYSTATDSQKHSAAHVMAMAVQRLYKNVKVGIGPVTKDGFYYDFDLRKNITRENFKEIEEEMLKIKEERIPFTQHILSREEAINLLLTRGQIYKVELINSIPDTEVSLYKTGEEFIDLCRGPHVEYTSDIGIPRIIKIEKVHWNNDPKRPKLLRVYGKVFNSESEIEQYKQVIEEKRENSASKVAERIKIGVINDRFTQLNEYGINILTKLENIIKNDEENIMFLGIDDISEKFGILNSNFEKINTDKLTDSVNYYFSHTNNANKDPLSGYIVNYFKETDIVLNLSDVINKINSLSKVFDAEYFAEIYSNDHLGNLAMGVSNILQKKLISHNKINSSIETLELKYKFIDNYNEEFTLISQKVLMYQSKRFGNLFQIITKFDYHQILKFALEKFKGKLPVAICPREVVIIPIKKIYSQFAKEINANLLEEGIISNVDLTSKSIDRKIYLAETRGVPNLIIVGEKEESTNYVSLRKNSIDEGLIPLEKIIEHIKQERTKMIV